jgi:hypothetical protein
VVATYRRLASLEKILTAWLEQGADVWLADSSDQFYTSLPVHHVRFAPDPGNATRHALALLATGDYVIKADDDVMPQPGLVEAFVAHSKLCGILGLMGRTFQGDLYYGKTTPFRAREITHPKRVDMVGIVTFTPREHMAFDLMGCTSAIEDLFWHMKAFPGVPKYVIPTDKYIQLPESDDAECLFRNLSARKERETFYGEWYKRNYAR